MICWSALRSTRWSTKNQKLGDQAVRGSGDRAATTSLYSLTAGFARFVEGGRVGDFPTHERPSPSDYLSRLHGGATEKNLISELQSEARQFGLDLPCETNSVEAFSDRHFRARPIGGPGWLCSRRPIQPGRRSRVYRRTAGPDFAMSARSRGL